MVLPVLPPVSDGVEAGMLTLQVDVRDLATSTKLTGQEAQTGKAINMLVFKLQVR